MCLDDVTMLPHLVAVPAFRRLFLKTQSGVAADPLGSGSREGRVAKTALELSVAEVRQLPKV